MATIDTMIALSIYVLIYFSIGFLLVEMILGVKPNIKRTWAFAIKKFLMVTFWFPMCISYLFWFILSFKK